MRARTHTHTHTEMQTHKLSLSLNLCVGHSLISIRNTCVDWWVSSLIFIFYHTHTIRTLGKAATWNAARAGLFSLKSAIHTALWCKTKTLSRAEPLIIRHIIITCFLSKVLQTQILGIYWNCMWDIHWMNNCNNTTYSSTVCELCVHECA